MEILSFPEAATPLVLREQVRALVGQAWPGDPANSRHEHDPKLKPTLMLVVDAGRLLSCLAILTKDLTHMGRRYAASGLSAVVTSQAERNKGHGHRLVTAAASAVAASAVDLGIFTCDKPLQGFYERAGWQVLPGTVVIGGTREAPFPSDQFDKVTLAAFFTDHARRHALDFEHARIELYPGDIDKLW